MRLHLLVLTMGLVLGCSAANGPAATMPPGDDVGADASAAAEVAAVDVITEAAAEASITGTGGVYGGTGGVQAPDAGQVGTGGAGGAVGGSGGAAGTGGVSGPDGGGTAYLACTKPTSEHWVPCAAPPDPRTGFSDRTYSKVGHLACVLCTGANVVDCVAIGNTLCVRGCSEGNCE